MEPYMVITKLYGYHTCMAVIKYIPVYIYIYIKAYYDVYAYI